MVISDIEIFISISKEEFMTLYSEKRGKIRIEPHKKKKDS